MENKKLSESHVEGYLVKRCKEEGWLCEKFIPEVREGMPDRMILLPDRRILWAETKRPVGGLLSPAQKLKHEKLRRAGQEVWVPRARDDVELMIDYIHKSILKDKNAPQK